MRRALTLVVLCVFALTSASALAKKPKKKVRWTPIPHQEYKVEAEVGALLTCAYKVVDAGQHFEAVDEDLGLKVRVIKPGGGDLELTLFWNHKLKRNQINGEKVTTALQGAVDACFEKLYGGDDDEE